MNTYKVTVRTMTEKYEFKQLGFTSASVAENALARFGGLCAVTVVPA